MRIYHNIFMALKTLLSIERFLKDRFDVNDRRAIQRLQGAYSELPLHVNLKNLNTMQTHRVWTVRRTRCKNPL